MEDYNKILVGWGFDKKHYLGSQEIYKSNVPCVDFTHGIFFVKFDILVNYKKQRFYAASHTELN